MTEDGVRENSMKLVDGVRREKIIIILEGGAAEIHAFHGFPASSRQ